MSARHLTRARFAELERRLAAVTAQRDDLLKVCQWIADNPFAAKENMIATATVAIAKVQS